MQYVLGVRGNGAIGLHTLHRKPNSWRPTAGVTFSVKETCLFCASTGLEAHHMPNA